VQAVVAVQVLRAGSAAAAPIHSGASGAAAAQGRAGGGGALRRSCGSCSIGRPGTHQILQTQTRGLGGHGLQAIEGSTDHSPTAVGQSARSQGRGRAGDHAHSQTAAPAATAHGGGAVHSEIRGENGGEALLLVVVVVQRRLLVRRVGGVRGVQRRQVVVPPRELRRDDVLEVLQESRRLEAGIFQLR